MSSCRSQIQPRDVVGVKRQDLLIVLSPIEPSLRRPSLPAAAHLRPHGYRQPAPVPPHSGPNAKSFASDADLRLRRPHAVHRQPNFQLHLLLQITRLQLLGPQLRVALSSARAAASPPIEEWNGQAAIRQPAALGSSPSFGRPIPL